MSKINLQDIFVRPTFVHLDYKSSTRKTNVQSTFGVKKYDTKLIVSYEHDLINFFALQLTTSWGAGVHLAFQAHLLKVLVVVSAQRYSLL